MEYKVNNEVFAYTNMINITPHIVFIFNAVVLLLFSQLCNVLEVGCIFHVDQVYRKLVDP
jgi:hypothetical protein